MLDDEPLGVAVNTMLWVAPGASVKVFGVAMTVKLASVAEVTVHEPLVLRRFLTTRVQEQPVVSQAVLRSSGRFKVFTSPGVAESGLAAKKCAVVSSMVRPASAALLRSTRPLPMSSIFQGVVPSSSTPLVLVAVIMSADLTSITDQSGCTARTSAAAPVT